MPQQPFIWCGKGLEILHRKIAQQRTLHISQAIRVVQWVDIKSPYGLLIPNTGAPYIEATRHRSVDNALVTSGWGRA